MGNSLGGKKTVKIMKISGETFKLKTPVKAGEVIKNHPGLVLLESEAVKHYGTRAKPLEPQQELVPKRLYFLVELPETSAEKSTRRVRSEIHMSAKDRLENLMLARRSTSDLSIINPSSTSNSIVPKESGAMRVKMRVPKAQVEKLMEESKDEAEATAKIMDLCMANKGGKSSIAPQQQVHWTGGHRRAEIESVKTRVSFSTGY